MEASCASGTYNCTPLHAKLLTGFDAIGAASLAALPPPPTSFLSCPLRRNPTYSRVVFNFPLQLSWTTTHIKKAMDAVRRRV